jgi:hypothetical protein
MGVYTDVLLKSNVIQKCEIDRMYFDFADPIQLLRKSYVQYRIVLCKLK